MLDVHRRGGQGSSGEPSHIGRSSSWRSRFFWRTPPRWTFIVVEVKVLPENPPTLDVHRRGGQGSSGEPPHVGRSSSWRSRFFWRTPPRWTFIVVEVKLLLENPPILDIHRRGGQGSSGEPPHVGRSLSGRSRFFWRTLPYWTFIVVEVKVLLENPPTLDVHCRGGQASSGEPSHIGHSSLRRSRFFWRTPPRWTFIVREVKVPLQNPPVSDIEHHGHQGSSRTPPCWTFIVMEFKVLLENPPILDVHRHGDQGAPGEPPHVGRSPSWRSQCWRTSPRWTFTIMEVTEPPHVGHSSSQTSWSSWRTSPRWTFTIMEVTEPPHVGRSSSRTSWSSWRTSPRWTFTITEVTEPPHVGRSSSWRSRCSWRTSPRWTFTITEVKVLLDTWVPWTLGCPPPPPQDTGVPAFLPPPSPVWLR
ncbi:uncharacterized protein LOC141735312 [Larus michahellis]|uniref:uncharacterized protein LOC141735312 n=1 Tax=Larus michahellis TaxID=119627 RepID=UPI003D9BDA09